MEFDENNYKEFAEINRSKIENYIEHINIISYIDEPDLTNGLETLKSINPKVMDFWMLINEGSFIANMLGLLFFQKLIFVKLYF